MPLSFGAAKALILQQGQPYESSITWTPNDLGVDLWLDAQDTSTITESSNQVVQWDDKSGNSRHLSQPIIEQRPIYNLTAFNGAPAVTFDGINDNLYTDSAGCLGASNVSFFILMKRITLNGEDIPFGLGKNGQFYQNRFLYSSNAGDYNNTIGFSNWGSGAPSSFSTDTGGDYHIVEIVQSGSNMYFYLDGAEDTVMPRIMNLAPEPISTNYATLGSFFNSFTQYATNMSVAEVVICYNDVGDSDRKKIEGYMAHKWGIAASLPANHPYKNTAPTNNVASGGTVTTISDGGFTYRVHTFTDTGNNTFQLNSAKDLEYLIVGGGGGGGGTQGDGNATWGGTGGGGAGGMLEGTVSASANSYTVVVGAGGNGGAAGGNNKGSSGSDSSVAGGVISLIATGGGGGGQSVNIENCSGLNGGSGGGGGATWAAGGGTSAAGSATSGQGNAGGAGQTTNAAPYRGAGGGGAGSAGVDGTSTGNGGSGKSSSISGTSIVYAAGGGAGTFNGSTSLGGSSIGGNGANTSSSTAATNGTANHGAGGGGAAVAPGGQGSTSPIRQGGNGGSGVVIIRYKI